MFHVLMALLFFSMSVFFSPFLHVMSPTSGCEVDLVDHIRVCRCSRAVWQFLVAQACLVPFPVAPACQVHCNGVWPYRRAS